MKAQPSPYLAGEDPESSQQQASTQSITTPPDLISRDQDLTAGRQSKSSTSELKYKANQQAASSDYYGTSHQPDSVPVAQAKEPGKLSTVSEI